ncbi:hypothetical protein [Streptomyces sp. NPDC005438]|uniref:hypothetical protein n=1 Tax=Streptomyces sp. NPDC005438 TaxID=3156880 RepID=UPI0033B0E52A
MRPGVRPLLLPLVGVRVPGVTRVRGVTGLTRVPRVRGMAGLLLAVRVTALPVGGGQVAGLRGVHLVAAGVSAVVTRMTGVPGLARVTGLTVVAGLTRVLRMGLAVVAGGVSLGIGGELPGVPLLPVPVLRMLRDRVAVLVVLRVATGGVLRVVVRLLPAVGGVPTPRLGWLPRTRTPSLIPVEGIVGIPGL